MKKFLLSAAMLLLGVVATFAQEWTIGQEIEGVVQNPSFTIPKDQDIKWQYVNTSGPTVEQLFESWNSGTETQVFQYVQLPKGKYRLTCQGYYRGGGENEDTNNFMNYATQWQDNAWLFVQNGEYTDGNFTGAHIFKNPLMPRLFELVEEQIYFGVDGDADWAIDHSHVMGPNTIWGAAADGKTVWGPGGVNGSVAWFNAGKYMPYEQDGIIYNIVDFFLPQDGYVKLGSMKTGQQSGGDTFFMTNVKLYYEGQPTEEEIYNLAQSDLKDLYKQVENLLDEYEDGCINVLMSEEFVGVIQETYGDDPDEMDMETVTAATAACQELLKNVTKAIADMNTMNATISSIESLLKTTDKAGKPALQAAVDAAKKLTTDEYVYDEDNPDGWDVFELQNKALNEARLAYMDSGEASEYPKDYTSFINFPWFCNPEFEPTWDEENQTWVANEAAMATEWKDQNDIDSTEDGWYTDNQGNKITITETNFLADKVFANAWTNDQNSVGKWYQVNNGLVLYWNDNLTCVKKWDMPHTEDGVREIAQNIANLPKGFYKLKALGQTWTNDWDDGEKLCKSRIYLQSGDQVSESNYLPVGGWWGRDIKQWQELETDFVQVTDGTLKIAAHDNGFVAWTGFRLFYYGETPDFDQLLKPSYDAAVENANSLSFAGDQKKANELLGKIPSHITSSEEYLAAQQDLAAAVDYIKKAKAATDNWQTPDNFMNLMNANEGDVAAFLDKAWDAAWSLEDEEDAVYTDALAFNDLYKAYESYVNYRASLGKFLEDAAVATIISDQNDYLKANVATVEKLEEFKNTLGAPVNTAKFKEMGSDNATLANPIDVTFLLQNPKFHEGHSKGWDCVKGNGTYCNDNLGIEFDNNENGERTLYRTISEIWGASDPFTISQTLNGLPAGTYEIRTHTLYRNGGGPDLNEFKEYLEDEELNEGDPNWNFKNNYAKVFAEGINGQYRQEIPVSYIYSLRINEPSFLYHSCYDWYTYADDVEGNYETKTVEFLADYEDELEDFLAGFNEEQLTYAADYEGRKKGDRTAVAMNSIPFDKKLTVEEIDPEDDMPIDVDYFFSQRTIGLVEAVKLDPNNYLNKLYVNLPEGGSLTLGIDKEKSGQGSLAMYDWELWYCGTEIPTDIKDITEAGEAAAAEGAIEYYTINGVKLNAPQKGINIIKQGTTVKKVFIQ